MTLQINDYRMVNGHLVRITGTMDHNHHTVEFVTILDREGDLKAVSAGDSRSWSDAVLSSVTDPKMIAAAKAFEANRRYEEMDKALDDAWAEVVKWNGVLQCIHEAEWGGVAV